MIHRAGELRANKLSSSLDLIEIRRKLIILRSRHSHQVHVTRLINKVFAKIAHLREPENKAHEKSLQNLIANTLHTVERITSSHGS